MNKRILNLGAGTQSSVLYFMMCRDELLRADYAVFSDTGWEPKAVYEHLQWMEDQGGEIPIVRVGKGNIRDDSIRSMVRGRIADGTRWASMPLYTRRLWLPSDAAEFERIFITGQITEEETLWGLLQTEGKLIYRQQLADLRRGFTVEHKGIITRQCTSEYKIEPIRFWIKEHVFGLAKGDRWPTEPAVEQVFGISFDERHRVRMPEKWGANSYPLVDLRWSRGKAIEWARREFAGHVFPRSACIGCPYHSNDEWRNLRDGSPDEWADAVDFDVSIRQCGGMRGETFVHRDCVPLADADLSVADDSFIHGMANECEGMCGV